MTPPRRAGLEPRHQRQGRQAEHLRHVAGRAQPALAGLGYVHGGEPDQKASGQGQRQQQLGLGETRRCGRHGLGDQPRVRLLPRRDAVVTADPREIGLVEAAVELDRALQLLGLPAGGLAAHRLALQLLELGRQRLLARLGAGDLAVELAQQRPALVADLGIEPRLLGADVLDTRVALAILPGQLRLAPQQLGLERHQIVQHGRAAELAERGRRVAGFDQLPQPAERRLLGGPATVAVTSWALSPAISAGSAA